MKLVHIQYLSLSILLLLFSAFIYSCDSSSDYDRLKLEEITIQELQNGYENGDYTVSEVVEAYLDRIEAIDKNGVTLNSIIQINPDVMEIAQQLDSELVNDSKRSPLFGIPVILKDNIDTNDKMSTTAGSRAMEGSQPLKDAFIVEKLRASGAVILGKANLSEWANFHSSFSSSGWSGLGGQTKNPYDTSRNPCGSSAGSGVAASANLTVIAIGTETNGSITCPANANGIVGIKPTVGLLSRSGIIPISFTQDTPGPMTRTVTDAAIALGAMTGIDSMDTKTLGSLEYALTDYTEFLNVNGLEGKRIGLYTGPLGNHHQVDSLFYKRVREIENAGSEIIEINQISVESPGRDSFTVLLYEFKDGLNRYFESLGSDAPVNSLEDLIEQTIADSIEMQYFDHDLLIRAQETNGLDSKEYQEALTDLMRKTRKDGLDKVMNDNNLDAIISPTGGPAWKTDLINGDNFGLSSSSPAARAGYPNITVPMGDINGLPVGMSFFGKAWSEPELIEIAYAFEQLTNARIIPQLKNGTN